MQRQTRREQQQLTRQRLTRSGLETVALCGVQGTRIEQVARDAGLTKGAFYAHFDDKLAMTLEILRDRQVVDLAFWEATLDAAADHASCLDEVIRQSGVSARVNGLLGLELHLEAERNEAFRPHFMAYLDCLLAEVGRVLCKVLRRNGKAPPADLHEVVAEIYLLGSSAGVTSFFSTKIKPEQFTGDLIRARVKRAIAEAPALGPDQDEEAGAEATSVSPI